MLYKEPVTLPNEGREKLDFLFEAQPYNQDIDIKEIAAIERFFDKNGYIPEKYITTLLNWMTYQARVNITSPLESKMDTSYAGRCAVAQAYYKKLCGKLGFKTLEFNVGDIVGTDPIHALTGVIIPTKVGNMSEEKTFILDPTFRQFCLSEENRFERYNEEPRWSVRMSTPHPGYFFNLTKDGRAFAERLITYGYFEATEDNLKTYFGPFTLYVTPKDSYVNQELVGKVATTKNSGADYWARIISAPQSTVFSNKDFQLDTPVETISREQNKFKNRVRRFFSKSELDDMFIDDNEVLQKPNQTK